MAKIHKIKNKDNETVYIATIPQAVVDPEDGQNMLQKLALKAAHGYVEGDTVKTLKEVEITKASHGYSSAPKTLKQVDDAKAAHGYVGEETVKTLKEVETIKASHGYSSAPKTLKEVEDLSEKVSDMKAIQPAVDYNRRVTADSGLIGDKGLLLKLYTDKMKALPSTHVLYCPHLGSKQRTSGDNKFASVLYDLGNSALNASQATEASQPYMGGFIAPNEKLGLKYVQGQTMSGQINFTPKAYLATDSWTLTMVVKPNSLGAIKLGASSQILFDLNRLTVWSGSSGSTLRGEYYPEIGKSLVIESQYSNGAGTLKVNGKIIPLVAEPGFYSGEFNQISYDSLDNQVFYFHLQNERISEIESQQNYRFLRDMFTEIEGVNIGSQHWATSNYESTVVSGGTVINEVKNSDNVVLAENNYEDGALGVIINDIGGAAVTMAINEISPISGTKDLKIAITTAGTQNIRPLYQAKTSIAIVTGRVYKISFKYKILSGSVSLYRIWISSSTPVFHDTQLSGVGTFTTYVVSQYSGAGAYIGLNFDGTKVGEFQIDDVKLEDVGTVDAQNVYNAIYAQTIGTAAVKDLAATKAAAMWCYFDNSPDKGAVYGKLYNWYAIHLIDLLSPKGWRVPSNNDFLQLTSYIGSAVKAKAKFSVFNIATNTNESGLSIIPAGYRSDSGNFLGSNVYTMTSTIIYGASAVATSFIASWSNAVPNRMASLRLLRNSPVGDNREEFVSGQFSTGITAVAKSIPIKFGYAVKEIRITTTTPVTEIEAKMHNSAGTAVATLITGKSCNATSTTFIVTADQPTLLQDGSVRVTAAGNTDNGMNITIIAEKVIL